MVQDVKNIAKVETLVLKDAAKYFFLGVDIKKAIDNMGWKGFYQYHHAQKNIEILLMTDSAHGQHNNGIEGYDWSDCRGFFNHRGQKVQYASLFKKVIPVKVLFANDVGEMLRAQKNSEVIEEIIMQWVSDHTQEQLHHMYDVLCQSPHITPKYEEREYNFLSDINAFMLQMSARGLIDFFVAHHQDAVHLTLNAPCLDLCDGS